MQDLHFTFSLWAGARNVPYQVIEFPINLQINVAPIPCTVNLILISEGLYITSIQMAKQCQQPISKSIALIWYNSDNVEMLGKFELDILIFQISVI